MPKGGIEQKALRVLDHSPGTRVEVRCFKRESEVTDVAPSLSVFVHTLYIEFKKKDFPCFRYPVKKYNEYAKRDLYDYFDSSFTELDVHGGITFYREEMDCERDERFVTLGWDFEHSGDEATWGQGEQVGKIMDTYGRPLRGQLIDLHEKIKGRQ